MAQHAELTWEADGTETNFAITFNYIDRSHIHVFVDNEEVTYSSTSHAFSFADDENLTITRLDGTPVASGTKIHVARITPTTEALVSFSDGAVIRAGDLNTNTNQVLYVAQEVQDRDGDRLGTNNNGDFDANNKKIVNVADPVDAGDAINKGTFDTMSAGIYSAQQTTSTNAQAAINSASSAAQALAEVNAVKASIEGYYNSFGDRYLGELGRDPDSESSGPFEDGTLYYNTTLKAMRVYGAGHWRNVITAPQALITEHYYVATEGQTVFSGADREGTTLSFSSARAQVYVNGVRMSNRDFSMTTDSITLMVPATAGDLVHITSYSSFAPANVVPAAGGGTFLGAVSFDAGIQIGDWKITAGSRYLQFFHNDQLKAQITDDGKIRLGTVPANHLGIGTDKLDPTETL